MIEIAYLLPGIFIIFVPGFLLSFLLYQGPGRLDFWERFIMSIGLSALVDMLIVTILAQPSIKALRLLPVVSVVLLFSGACGLLLTLKKDSLRAFVDFWRRSE